MSKTLRELLNRLRDADEKQRVSYTSINVARADVLDVIDATERLTAENAKLRAVLVELVATADTPIHPRSIDGLFDRVITAIEAARTALQERP